MKDFRLYGFALIFMSLLISSCGKDSDCTEVDLGETFEFQESDVICIDDTYELTITKVEDERCPCFANCVWAGEFLFRASITDGNTTNDILIHEESLVTQPETNIFDLSFANVALITKDDCTDPVNLEDMVFEMSVVTP